MPELAYVDREMWEKIVLNLVSNAFKFTFEGLIEVRLRNAGAHFELTVRDTGIGIPAAELPKLFERFHRVADARGRTHEGSGIGLALVQDLVRCMAGWLKPRASMGKAQPSAFAFRSETIICKRKSDQVSGGRRPRSERSRSSRKPCAGFRTPPLMANTPFGMLLRASKPKASRLSAPRILLVDDSADMRDYLQRLLGDRYDVQVAGDGIAALEAIEKSLPDLVLSDIMMPQLDGLGLLARLRSNPHTSTLPIILVSARAGEELRMRDWRRARMTT